MADNERIMHFANFNVTFGPKEEPMLTHFEDIIFPAFLSDYKRGKLEERPLFYMADVYIKKINDELVLVGNYIKDTQYDVHTTIKDGELVSTPTSVPTAPYSRFIIFLKNHRMILVRNESQSPDIRSFQATVRSMLNDFIHKENRKRTDKGQTLPHALVNIVDIPLSKDIEAVLKDVSKINWLQIRFFPLNNDINPIPVAEDIDKQMKKMGSKHAHVQFKSPDSKAEVKDLIDRSSGLAVSTLEVIDASGNKTKIKEEQFTSSTKIPFGRDIQPEDDGYIIDQAKKDGVVSIVSEANRKLYDVVKGAIERLIG
ncbi:hypothetical protein [uncultured Oscillibacter sp.]|uniref:hypothetical protein n=1 Tax=uncultured Oscillibacter sp. TaxID=876091 RepID=UPI0025FB0AAE|nr:hypothetical protein [uncultured Oscillibacter sp.]